MAAPVLLIITAGGMGKRFGKPYPKQLETIEGHSILRRTALFFEKIKPDFCVVTCPDGYDDEFRKELSELSFPVEIVRGGSQRHDSVKAAVIFLEGQNFPGDSAVLVHDAVRPFLRLETVKALIAAIRKDGAAVPYVPVTGTIRRFRDDEFQEAVERKDVVVVTTPQGATLEILGQCFKNQGLSYPDESTLLFAESINVTPIRDWHLNIKITTRDDLETAKMLWCIK